MKGILTKITVVLVTGAVIAFIWWWNWRLYSWFTQGFDQLTAGALVWGPFVLTALLVAWYLIRHRGGR